VEGQYAPDAAQRKYHAVSTAAPPRRADHSRLHIIQARIWLIATGYFLRATDTTGAGTGAGNQRRTRQARENADMTSVDTTAWAIDPSHTRISFAVRHMMVTTVRGSFGLRSGTVEFDQRDPLASRVEVVIDAASVNTGDGKRDGHLRSADFLDAAEHPDIVFRSTGITAAGDGYRIAGDLAIRGQSRPVALDARIEGVTSAMDGRRLAAFSATGRIRRSDWGLAWNVALESGGWLVGDDVSLVIDVEALAPAAGAVAVAA
jgi:polyisoprenoid-binding protein YceI